MYGERNPNGNFELPYKSDSCMWLGVPYGSYSSYVIRLEISRRSNGYQVAVFATWEEANSVATFRKTIAGDPLIPLDCRNLGNIPLSISSGVFRSASCSSP